MEPLPVASGSNTRTIMDSVASKLATHSVKEARIHTNWPGGSQFYTVKWFGVGDQRFLFNVFKFRHRSELTDFVNMLTSGRRPNGK